MAVTTVEPVFLPLFPDITEEVVLTDMIAYANEGVAPTEEEWVDVRAGSMVYIAIRPGARRIAHLYDVAGSEVPASAHPLWAYGQYLDDLAAVPGVERNAATFATGTVTFSGDPGLLIAAGIRVGVEPVTPDADAPEFDTTADGTIGGGGTVDVPVIATVAGTAGSVGAHTITAILTPGINADVDNAAPLLGGAEVEADPPFRERYLARYDDAQGGGNVTDLTNWTLEIDGVGEVSVIPLYAGPGTVLVVPMTAERGPVSQAIVDEVQDHLDPPAFRTTTTASVTLPQASIPVASTAGAKPPTGGGWIRIVDQAVSFASFDGTHFLGCAGGTGTFPSGTNVVQGGQAHGRDSVGQHVTVRTATGVDVDVAGTVEMESGYTLDGAGGTTALADTIRESLEGYFSTLGVGDEVVRAQVQAAIANVRGVHDVGAITLNGGSTNLAMSTDPPQLAVLDATTGIVAGTL